MHRDAHRLQHIDSVFFSSLQEPITRSEQLMNSRQSAFTDRFIFRFLFPAVFPLSFVMINVGHPVTKANMFFFL